MNNELKQIFFFLKVSKLENIYLRAWYSLDDSVDHFDFYFDDRNLSKEILPENFINFMEKICDELSESEEIQQLIYDNSVEDTYVDYLRCYITFKFDGIDEKIYLDYHQYYYGESEDYQEFEIERENVIEIFKKNKIKEFTCRYNGGGDSGYAEEFEIDSDKKISWETLSESEKSIIEDLVYESLENFGGWEINEGSSGDVQIVYDSNSESCNVDINHTWNTEEDMTIIEGYEIPENFLNKFE